MKKIAITLVILLGLIAAGYFYIVQNGSALIRDAAETHSPEMIGAKVSLAEVSLSPLSGLVGVDALTVEQPEGWGEGTMFSVDSFDVSIEPYSLMGDTLKVNSITIDKPVFNIVEKDGKTNLEALQDHLSKYVEDANDSTESVTQLSVKDFHLSGATINVSSEKFGEHSVTLADIHLTDIGVDEGGMPPAEVFRHVMDTLTPQVTKALITLGIKSKLKSVFGDDVDTEKPLDSLKKGLGKLFNKKKED